LGVTICAIEAFEGRRAQAQATVYQKHRSLLNAKADV
jgi:hypothetical protein